MASRLERYISANIYVSDKEEPYALVDSEEGRFASDAINSFENGRLIKTQFEDSGVMKKLYINPDKVVSIEFTSSTDSIEYTDDACQDR